MRASNRLSLLISTLSPLDLDLREGKNAWIVCPDQGCGQWVEVHRGLVMVHRHQGKRCPGSKRHLIFDLTPAQHSLRHAWVARRALLPSARKVTRLHSGRPTRGQLRTWLEAGWGKQIARVPTIPTLRQTAEDRRRREIDEARGRRAAALVAV